MRSYSIIFRVPKELMEELEWNVLKIATIFRVEASNHIEAIKKAVELYEAQFKL